LFKSLCQKSHISIISLILSFLFVFISNSGFAGAADPPEKDPAVQAVKTETQDNTSSESNSPSPDLKKTDIEENQPEIESSIPSEQKLQVDVAKANVRNEASLKAKINTPTKCVICK